MATLLLLLSTLLLATLLIFYLFPSRPGAAGRHRPPLPPGPRGWPVLGNLTQLGSKPHQTLATLSRTYGPLFHLRLGSVHAVVAASSEVAAALLKAHDANFSNRPPNSGAEHIAYNYQDLVFAPYGPRWRMLRKLCNLRLFSAKALDGFRHVREQEAELLARALHRADGDGGRGPGAVVNVGEEVNVCVANALARAVVGRRVFGDGVGKEAEEFRGMVVELMRLAGVFNVGDFVPWLGWLDPQGVVAQMKRLHRRYDAMLDEVIAGHPAAAAAGERTGRGEGEKTAAAEDLLSTMIGLRGHVIDAEGGTLTDTEIKALLLNLFTAGTDTTSSTVEWALTELIRHPELLARVQSELDSVVGRSRLVSDSDLAGLPFLHAAIKETFRLHPSTPLSLPRAASESCVVAGYHIPKNTILLVNVWAIARDPAVWADPVEFRPARFLPGGAHAHVDVRGNDFELIPFGAGRRICAGMSLGLRMVQFLTATLVHAFDWELPAGQAPEKLDMEEAYGLTLQRAVPLAARPVPRLDPDAYRASPRC